jgi:hypothetical protein
VYPFLHEKKDATIPVVMRQSNAFVKNLKC